MLALIVVVVLIALILVVVLTRFLLESEHQKSTLTNMPSCVRAHLSYPWLDGIHGGLNKIMYEEPAGSGVWKDYDVNIWNIHCKVIDHDPSNLVDAHMKAFVDPSSRFAKLHFYFKDGTVMEPTRQFYELERNWFGQNVH